MTNKNTFKTLSLIWFSKTIYSAIKISLSATFCQQQLFLVDSQPQITVVSYTSIGAQCYQKLNVKDASG